MRAAKLNWALVFFVAAIIAANFGFSGSAVGAAGLVRLLGFSSWRCRSVCWRPGAKAIFDEGLAQKSGVGLLPRATATVSSAIAVLPIREVSLRAAEAPPLDGSAWTG